MHRAKYNTLGHHVLTWSLQRHSQRGRERGKKWCRVIAVNSSRLLIISMREIICTSIVWNLKWMWRQRRRRRRQWQRWHRQEKVKKGEVLTNNLNWTCNTHTERQSHAHTHIQTRDTHSFDANALEFVSRTTIHHTAIGQLTERKKHTWFCFFLFSCVVPAGTWNCALVLPHRTANASEMNRYSAKQQIVTRIRLARQRRRRR